MLFNILSVAISDIINRGFFLFFSAVIARLISPSQFGYYSLSISLGIWLWSIVDIGMTAHGTRLLAQSGRIEDVVGRITGIRLVNLLVSGTLYCTVLFLLSIPSAEKTTYMAALLYAAGMCLFPAWVARSHHDNIAYTINYLIISVMGAMFLAAFSFGLIPNSGLGAIVSRNAAWVIGSGIAFMMLTKRLMVMPRLSFDFKMLGEAVPLGGAAIVYTLIPLVPFLALRFLDAHDFLGQYGAVWQVQAVLIAGASMLAAVFLPSYARETNASRKNSKKILLKKHFVLVTIVALPLSAGLWLMGKNVLGLIFGSRYQDLSPLILPFSLALLVIYYRVSIDAILTAEGKYVPMLINGIIILLISVISSLISKETISLAWVYMLAQLFLLIANASVAIATSQWVK